MDRWRFIKEKTRWLLIQFLFISTVSHEARGVYCPLTCVCDFNESQENNMATCTFGNTTMELSWLQNERHTKLEIFCVDEVEDRQHDCNNLPQYNISSNDTELVVRECAPSIIRCAQKMVTPSTIFTDLKTEMLAGSFTVDDLIGLEHVHIANINMKNESTEIQVEVLNALKSLEYLGISGGNLQFASNALILPKLKFLELQHNNIRDLPIDAFNGLPNLGHFDIQENIFEHLGANTFRGLGALRSLCFQHNALTNIHRAVLSTMKQLNELCFISNRLKLFPNGLFTGLDELQEIILSNNEVEMVLDTHAFANLPPSVKTVAVVECNVKLLPEYLFNGSVGINQLLLKRNQIESLPPKLFATATSLTYVNLNRNRIQNLPDGIFSELKQLEIIDLSYNHLSILTGNIFIHNTKLKEVKLNRNRLTYIDQDTFKGVKLRSLDLTSNKLQRITANVPLEWSTENLYLGNNELSVFEDWFVELVGLTHLELIGNKIKMIKASQIVKFKSETYIDLRNNNISEIIPDTSIPAANVTQNAVFLYLSQNPIRCDGTVTTLLKEWDERYILRDYSIITCDNGEKLSQQLPN